MYVVVGGRWSVGGGYERGRGDGEGSWVMARKACNSSTLYTFCTAEGKYRGVMLRKGSLVRINASRPDSKPKRGVSPETGKAQNPPFLRHREAQHLIGGITRYPINPGRPYGGEIEQQHVTSQS